MRKIPPRLGAWAATAPGARRPRAAPTATAVPPSFSTSRRLIVIGKSFPRRDRAAPGLRQIVLPGPGAWGGESGPPVASPRRRRALTLVAGEGSLPCRVVAGGARDRRRRVLARAGVPGHGPHAAPRDTRLFAHGSVRAGRPALGPARARRRADVSLHVVHGHLRAGDPEAAGGRGPARRGAPGREPPRGDGRPRARHGAADRRLLPQVGHARPLAFPDRKRAGAAPALALLLGR